jgi:hypothetical protein
VQLHNPEVVLLDSMIYPAQAVDQTCVSFTERCSCAVDGMVTDSIGSLWRVRFEMQAGENRQLLGQFLNDVLTAAIELHLAGPESTL